MNGACAHLDGNTTAVPGHDFELVGRGAALRPITMNYLPGQVKVFRRDDLREVQFKNVIAMVSCNALTRPVERCEVAGEIVRVDHIARILEQVTVPFLEGNFTLQPLQNDARLVLHSAAQ